MDAPPRTAPEQPSRWGLSTTLAAAGQIVAAMVAESMTAESGPAPKSNPPDADADVYAEAWTRVEAAWDDPDAHARFQALCAETGRLAEAGTRYRAVRESDPSRAEVASRQIDKLHALALTQLSSHRAPNRSLPALADRHRVRGEHGDRAHGPVVSVAAAVTGSVPCCPGAGWPPPREGAVFAAGFPGPRADHQAGVLRPGAEREDDEPPGGASAGLGRGRRPADDPRDEGRSHASSSTSSR